MQIFISNYQRGNIYETVAESSTKNLVDANAMYYNKRYGFEICTSRYRFRVFELRMTPLYPVEIINDKDYEIADFSRLKLIQTIDTIIEGTNFAELCQKHKSFAKVVEFIPNT